MEGKVDLSVFGWIFSIVCIVSSIKNSRGLTNKPLPPVISRVGLKDKDFLESNPVSGNLLLTLWIAISSFILFPTTYHV